MAKRIQRSSPKKKASRPSSGGGATGASRPDPRGKRVAQQVVTDFTIQLATLSGAGIPIVRALSVLEAQTRPGPFKEVLQELVEDVSAGTPVSEAMAKHNRCFDPLYASMVRAGEAGGVLDRILQRLATFREKAAEIKSRMVGATIYPVVVVLVALIVVVFVMIIVIPRFVEVFDSFDVELPEITQILLNVATSAREYWYVVVVTPIALVLGHLLLMRRQGYRHAMHRLLLRIPFVGPVVSQSMIAGFSRTFGTLIEAGVPHLEALGIVRDTTGNEVLLVAVDDIRRTVREGEGVSAPMADSGVFDDIVVSMVDVGEQTGELDGMLLRVADAYERQLDRRIDRLIKVLEPLLIVAIAIFVGFIVVALFLPLLKILSTLNQL